MTNENMSTPAKPKTWPKVLLAASLTLNLLVVGVVAGANFRDDSDARRFPQPERNAMRDSGFGPFVEALPRGVRERTGEALRGRAGDFAANRTALVGEVRAMLDALRAEPYDPGALNELMVSQQARVSERVNLGRAVLLEQVAAMSPRERAVFADRLEHGFRHALDGDRR